MGSSSAQTRTCVAGKAGICAGTSWMSGRLGNGTVSVVCLTIKSGDCVAGGDTARRQAPSSVWRRDCIQCDWDYEPRLLVGDERPKLVDGSLHGAPIGIIESCRDLFIDHHILRQMIVRRSRWQDWFRSSAASLKTQQRRQHRPQVGHGVGQRRRGCVPVGPAQSWRAADHPATD
jgi:hypothetical protein